MTFHDDKVAASASKRSSSSPPPGTTSADRRKPSSPSDLSTVEAAASATASSGVGGQASASAGASNQEFVSMPPKTKLEPALFKCGCDFGGADVTVSKTQGLDCDCAVAKCVCKKKCVCTG